MGLPLVLKKTEDPSIQFGLAFYLPLRNRKLICNDGNFVHFFAENFAGITKESNQFDFSGVNFKISRDNLIFLKNVQNFTTR